MRHPDDYYRTPSWCVDRLLEEIELPGGMWVDAGAGQGAIARAVNARRNNTEWLLVERNDTFESDLLAVERAVSVFIGSFYDCHLEDRARVVISNPPYIEALPFIEHALELADVVVMLLRLNFIASASRALFMRGMTPDVYVLPNRPSFTSDGATDSVEYAWFVWGQSGGRIRVLRTTSAEERR